MNTKNESKHRSTFTSSTRGSFAVFFLSCFFLCCHSKKFLKCNSKDFSLLLIVTQSSFHQARLFFRLNLSGFHFQAIDKSMLTWYGMARHWIRKALLLQRHKEVSRACRLRFFPSEWQTQKKRRKITFHIWNDVWYIIFVVMTLINKPNVAHCIVHANSFASWLCAPLVANAK